MKISAIILGTLLAWTASGCAHGIVEPPSTRGVKIDVGYGIFRPMCFGYCRFDMSVDDSSATLVRTWTTFDTAGHPDSTFRISLTDQERHDLREAIVAIPVRQADEVIGCPTCADGGEEHVRLTSDSVTMKVRFEEGSEVEGLEPILSVLRAIRRRIGH